MMNKQLQRINNICKIHMHRRDKIFKNVSKITSRIRPNMQLQFCTYYIYNTYSKISSPALWCCYVCVYNFSSGHQVLISGIFVNSTQQKHNRNISWEKYDIRKQLKIVSKLSPLFLNLISIPFPYLVCHNGNGAETLKMFSPEMSFHFFWLSFFLVLQV